MFISHYLHQDLFPLKKKLLLRNIVYTKAHKYTVQKEKAHPVRESGGHTSENPLPSKVILKVSAKHDLYVNCLFQFHLPCIFNILF